MSQAQTELVARISPHRPKGSPDRLTLPWMEGLGRRFYDADLGFVPVNPQEADLLKQVHADGELTGRGGKGPILFEVCSKAEAARIVQLEQKRALLKAAGSDAALAAAFAGSEWTDEELGNLGLTRTAPSALEIARAATARADAPSQATVAPPAGDQPLQASPSPGPARVGRRPPKGGKATGKGTPG